MSAAVNYDDVISQLESIGLILNKPIRTDTTYQRWKVTGEDKDERGWSRLREWVSAKGNVYIVGNYGVWHGNDNGNIKISLPSKEDDSNKLTKEDIANIKAAQKEAQRKLDEQRKAEIKVATELAQRIWLKCTPCTEHDYLTRKLIKSHGLRKLDSIAEINFKGIDDGNKWRLEQAVGALVVPMHDAEGEVCGLQFVYPRAHPRKQQIDRDKEFWPSGMAMGGSFGLIGHINNGGIILLGEGYATMASLYEAAGISVCYAFSANNLAKAAKALRKKYPRLRILFAQMMTILQMEILALVLQFLLMLSLKILIGLSQILVIQMEMTDEKVKLTDFNDLFVLAGNHLMLASQINDKLTVLNWRVPPLDWAGSQSGGRDEKITCPCSIQMRLYRDFHQYGRWMMCFISTMLRMWSSAKQASPIECAAMGGIWSRQTPSGKKSQKFASKKWILTTTNTDIAVKYNLWHGLPELQSVKDASCDALLRSAVSIMFT
jgi:putative DNA primase/helicase